MASMKEFMASRKAEKAPANGNGKPVKVEAPPKMVVTHSCGHKTGVHYLQGSLCRGCQNRQHRERRRSQPTARQRRTPTAGRLPDNSSFALLYDAAAQAWTGTLTVGGTVFEASASGVGTLCGALDTAYRATLPPQQTGEPPV
jgi:hypothetical protein